MADPRTAAIRDAAQFMEYAAAKLLEADALSPASDRRARKLLGHVQTCSEVARGLVQAMEKTAERGCETCRHREEPQDRDPCRACSKAPFMFWEPKAVPERRCGTCRFLGAWYAGRCCVDPVPTGEHDLPPKSPASKGCKYWQAASAPRPVEVQPEPPPKFVNPKRLALEGPELMQQWKGGGRCPPSRPGRSRSPARRSARGQARRAQEIRQRWRVLLLLLKAKLESCECGLTRFEDEFLGSMLLPGNRTVAQALEGQLAEILAGKVPLMLPGLGGTTR